MADQKALKKRLKVLMQRPENQVCSDCPEKKPTWASLIAPPPGAPPGTEKIGAFCCLECSGSHRRLGVHISFVRSINLDSWKEWEVRAMEAGGNYRVNSIFEANLAASGKRKPSNLARGQERERFIRDKYERRKYYNGLNYTRDVPPPSDGEAPGQGQRAAAQGARPGAPSEAARKRVANRQARMKTTQSGDLSTSRSARKPQIASAPVSAPVTVDLLDFGGATTTPAAPSAFDTDPFAAQPPAAAPAVAPASDPFAMPAAPPAAPVPPAPPKPQVGGDFADFAQIASNPAPPQPQAQASVQSNAGQSNSDIMALFGSPTQGAGGFAMPGTMMSGAMPGAMPGMPANPQMMGMMGMNMPANMGNTVGANMGANKINGVPGMPQQAPQQPSINPAVAANKPAAAPVSANNAMPAMNPMQMQQMMMQMGMMNPQMMAMMGNMNGMQQAQQQPQKQQQQPTPAAMMPGMQQMMGGMAAPQMQQQQKPQQSNPQQQMMMMNMMQGMQQMGLANGGAAAPPGGVPMPQAQPMAPVVSDGFGAPMGAGNDAGAGNKDDPFSALGGMNAFR